jgi:hypothetical protein
MEDSGAALLVLQRALDRLDLAAHAADPSEQLLLFGRRLPSWTLAR